MSDNLQGTNFKFSANENAIVSTMISSNLDADSTYSNEVILYIEKETNYLKYSKMGVISPLFDETLQAIDVSC